MAKKIIALLLCLLMLLALAGCGQPRIVLCDRCGAEIHSRQQRKNPPGNGGQGRGILYSFNQKMLI